MTAPNRRRPAPSPSRLIGLYLLATAFSATDEDLLLDRTLAISQLSAQIPVTVSFAMMPILFVALHVFTLIRYDMLAANVRQFSADLDAMVPVEADRERCRQLLANVEFIQSLTAPPGSALRSRLFGFVAWVVIAGVSGHRAAGGADQCAAVSERGRDQCAARRHCWSIWPCCSGSTTDSGGGE